MKYLLILFLGLVSLSALGQDIPPRPSPARLVNDFANVMSADQRAALERKLVAYDDSTSNQIVVVTIPTTGDYGIEEYALKILRDWGVGNKEKNNGIVIVAAITDRKIRIETGYGLEGAVPDITANEIITNQIQPNFREGNYYQGFDQATNQLIRAAAGEYAAPANYGSKKSDRSGGGTPIPIIIILIIIVFIISRRGGGGGGRGMMNRRGYNPFWGGFLGGMIGGNLGRGGGGGGGGWSGGGGGGGFGGFGGGSGGGGGASGSW